MASPKKIKSKNSKTGTKIPAGRKQKNALPAQSAEQDVRDIIKLQAASKKHPSKISDKKHALSAVIGIPDDFQLTREFSDTFDEIENTNQNFYITGNAGTGKSTLLYYFKEKTKKKTVLLAPTGIAAINIGGSTIHSFFRFPSHILNEEDIRKLWGKESLFAAMETLVIDEVSMVRADIMDAIDHSLRLNRSRPYDPFGGVQIVLIGDLFQLPPVVPPDLEEYFKERYETPYFFSATVFKEAELQKIELQKVFRQDDPSFIALLNKVRTRDMEMEDLDKINERYAPALKLAGHDLAITLTSTNARAASINLERLASLPSEEFFYNASTENDFDDKSMPTDKVLHLKKGAQVMMVKNDPNKRWVNGSLGIVEDLTRNSITVSFDGVQHTIEQSTWDKLEYEYDRESGLIEPFVTGSFRQYPIKLAWAMTIHKSQGKTFNKVIIDLGRGAFAHGQTYVALSRCRTFEGIFLKTLFRPSDIIVDQRIKEWQEN
jgi:ATP-dependent exoDNAse (exonuclease V) alpha subunit